MANRVDESGIRYWVMMVVVALLVGLGGLTHAAGEPQPAAAPSWASAPEQISVTGIITSIADENLRVSYGKGELTVSLAGWDWHADEKEQTPPPLSVGENVTVTGEADADLFSRRILRAQSVYVYDRHSLFTASFPNANSTPRSLLSMPTRPLYGRDPVTVSLAGEVTDIVGDEFSLEVGTSLITVDTGSMTYNPLDEIGAQQIQLGDWVQVGGKLENDFFEDHRLDANRVTSIYPIEMQAM